jgi:radical SAM enzyme (TIGR01210 family)
MTIPGRATQHTPPTLNPVLNSSQIVAARPDRYHVDPWRPHGVFIEPERSASRTIDDVLTILLVNSECPFKCVYCDLWKNTTVEPTPSGAIPAQIEIALEQVADRPRPPHIKLYNSGNFFDRRAVPLDDHPAIADRVRDFETVIVENHPKLTGDDCLRFRDRITPARLEVAMGLETVHPDVLPQLNKGMTLQDFERAARFLMTNGIATRAFILLRPPFFPPGQDDVAWAIRAVEFTANCGVGVCSIIPTRDGNGMMEQLAASDQFQKPRMRDLEAVLDRWLGNSSSVPRLCEPCEGEASLEDSHGRGTTEMSVNAGVPLARPVQAQSIIPTDTGGASDTHLRVFADLWDARRFAECEACADARIARMAAMNRLQQPIPPVNCAFCGR